MERRNRSVQYGSHTRGADIAFRESSFTMHLARQSPETSPKRARGGDVLTSRAREEAVLDIQHEAPHADCPHTTDAPTTPDDLTLTVTFPGSNNVQPAAARPQSAKFNYYLGENESNWASNVPSFGEIVYPNLYDGIDSLCIDSAGNLQIATPLGTLTDAAPLVWQQPGTSRDNGSAPSGIRTSECTTIPAQFELVDDTTYTITLDGSIDPLRELIIAGFADSGDIPERTNSHHDDRDAIVARVTSSGEIAWVTYLGGNDHDVARGVTVNAEREAFAVGKTRSADFEGRLNAYHGGLRDAFAARLDAEGSLQSAALVGGRHEEEGYAIARDSVGDLWMTGHASSTAFANRVNDYRGGNDDAFIINLSPSGAVRAMMYAGGTRSDIGNAICIDAQDRVLLGGSTGSVDIPNRTNSVHGTHFDGFVSRFEDLFVRPRLLVTSESPNGGSIKVEWFLATPQGRIALLFARECGAAVIPPGPPRAGTVLAPGGTRIVVAFHPGAGELGGRRMRFEAAHDVCGGHLQLLDVATCTTSNVAQIQ